MSHFSVMVIGPDVDAQLAPYHEFECTGRVDQYVQDVDITAELRDLMANSEPGEDTLEYALEYHGLEEAVVEDEAQVDRQERHRYGFAVVRDGQLVRAVQRTNPNKRWDWYQVGGRWTGMLRLRPGASGVAGSPGLMTPAARPGWTDQARCGDIDWAGMRDEAGEAAGQLWDRVRHASPELWTSWEDIRAQHANDIAAARQAYNNQPGRQRLWGDEELVWCDDGVLASREEYVNSARAAAGMTYAFVRDAQWIERGTMGWWGISTGDMPISQWHARMAEMIDQLPDDTLITVVDCHI